MSVLFDSIYIKSESRQNCGVRSQDSGCLLEGWTSFRETFTAFMS